MCPYVGDMRTLVWFRGKDLRLADHAPLTSAINRGGDVVPLFVVDDFFFAPERAQQLPHRMQFLLQSLASLQHNIEALGSRLLLVRGRSTDVVPQVVRDWSIDKVVAHRWSEPLGRERDRRVQEALSVPFQLMEGEMLVPPETVRTGAGQPFSVFTPFKRRLLADLDVGAPLPAPKALAPLPADLVDEGTATLPTMDELGLTKNALVLEGGERAARARMRTFLETAGEAYDERRNSMDDPAGTSRLSADLKFGTLSIRTLWQASVKVLGDTEGADVFRNELLWREFALHTLWDRPELLKAPFKETFVGFPWRDDAKAWEAWCTGHTGYPVVDAAARQLLAEGFVHNRARMIAASFLTKHLMLNYRLGEAHYMQHLTDGDWAANNLGWQWAAGCGCDAQPYFRVFNPMTQGQKFDVSGAYVRKWVPELAKLPTKHLHAPWQAKPDVLQAAGVTLGETYPEPIVDHKEARERFLSTAKAHLAHASALKSR